VSHRRLLTKPFNYADLLSHCIMLLIYFVYQDYILWNLEL